MMFTQTTRLAMITAALWFGFGLGGQAQAGPMLMTPAGLSPGQSFHFVFVTDGTTPATNSDIAFYDSFVTTQAGGATYNGSVIPWVAIGTTPTDSAIVHVGQSPDPVYLPDGTLITSNTTSTGLWSGTLLHPIDEDLTGVHSPTNVWTGTNAQGTQDVVIGTPLPLGPSFGLTGTGQTTASNFG